MKERSKMKHKDKCKKCKSSKVKIIRQYLLYDHMMCMKCGENFCIDREITLRQGDGFIYTERESEI